mmetsp:Transcript_19036/g.32020  ORF Transcript_19036/g.32020 Transcript_19036/m.32020 type:complete len:422 (-) Transcript_19036:104-1369(-)
MADEDNSTPATPPADTAETEASSAGADDAAVNDATAAISSIAVEDASDDEANEAVPAPPQEEEDEVVPPPPAAAAYQFNFNPPPPQPHLAADPNNMDFANLNPSEINAQFLSLLPPCIHPRLDKLKSLSEDRTKLLEQYLVERAELEQKYNGLMKPLYEMRRDVVTGICDGDIASNDTTGASDGEDQQEVKGIPQFWACAMGHIDLLAELITEEDVDCMEHLVDVTCDDFADGSGFELHFHFSPNDFFTNSVLTKRYEVPNLLTEDEPMLQSVTGTDIHWKPNKSLTHKTITKKQRKKGGPNAGQVRTIQKTERAESFFHFFTPPKMPELGDVVDEEEAEAMEEHFDHDYEMACAIRGSLIPNAVHWFTGEAMEEAMYGDEGMDMMFDEEDEEDDDGEGGLNPFPPPAAGEGEQNPECKQS